MLSPSDRPQTPAEKEAGIIPTHTNFQYSGTPEIVSLMNKGILDNKDSKARFEWPSSSIMHNKFIVMNDGKDWNYVWTGTANLSNHCTGTERNSNLSIFVKNKVIADAFKKEFEEMFEFDPLLQLKSAALESPEKDGNGNPLPIPMGHFHREKRPNTNRYFVFGDGTEARVHFAPTDDGEHRAILPMLLSARAGDIIRISMFGQSGYEYVRAIQYAVSKGAIVKILLDKQQGAGRYSWANAETGNLLQLNPYLNKNHLGSLTLMANTFSGKNHHKTATLTRKLSNGKYRAELIIIGSQNWSGSGNDSNDENMITIQNLKASLDIAKRYNDEFDQRLYHPLNVRPMVAKVVKPLILGPLKLLTPKPLNLQKENSLKPEIKMNGF